MVAVIELCVRSMTSDCHAVRVDRGEKVSAGELVCPSVKPAHDQHDPPPGIPEQDIVSARESVGRSKMLAIKILLMRIEMIFIP